MSQERIGEAVTDSSRPSLPGPASLIPTETTSSAGRSHPSSGFGAGPWAGARSPFPSPGAEDLPGSYGKDRLVLLVRDPRWLFAYWEVTEDTWERTRSAAGPAEWDRGRTVLRVVEAGAGVRHPEEANGGPAADERALWQAEVGSSNNWYVELGTVTSPVRAELGRLLPGGRFIPLLQSNLAFLPSADVSPVRDSEWLTIEEVWQRFVGLPPGTSSEALIRAVRARYGREAFSPGLPFPALMSPGFSPGFSPGRRQPALPAARPFWLTVATDLVVYGSTEPGARVTVGGEPVNVAADGSFRTRFNLVDGELVLPVVARQPGTGNTCETVIRIRRDTN
ncbi:MAG TPA: DUF4912 domain-containing protein [Firmicutes bacterium]|nr:DUF4912 domain-containing protein [Bacillota bacterium]